VSWALQSVNAVDASDRSMQAVGRSPRAHSRPSGRDACRGGADAKHARPTLRSSFPEDMLANKFGVGWMVLVAD
jgi:hypothetical protein